MQISVAESREKEWQEVNKNDGEIIVQLQMKSPMIQPHRDCYLIDKP